MTHTATILWERGDAIFTDRRYPRRHSVAFDGGVSMPVAPDPSYVRPPLGADDAADPEEMLVAAVSSCHMLFFLDFASRAGLTVDRYEDNPVGVMESDEVGSRSITHITLHPKIAWGGEAPTTQQLDELHHRAHKACFIANSIKGTVTVSQEGALRGSSIGSTWAADEKEGSARLHRAV